MITFIGAGCLDVNLVIKDSNQEVIRAKDQYINPGGNALNAAVTSASLKTSTCLITQLGIDQEGKSILDLLNKKDHLKTIYNPVGKTTKSHVLIYPNRRQFIVETYQSGLFKPTKDMKIAIQKSEIIDFYPRLLGSQFNSFYQLSEDKTKVISLKFLGEEIKNKRQYDILIESAEVVERPKEEDLLTIGAKVAILTNGKNGGEYWLKDRGWRKYQPVSIAKEVDNIGAGDAFRAGFLVGLSRGCSINKAIGLAARAGSVVASNKGSFLNDNLDF
jgi:sugar/nucleoside kinase (ribokinase family)